MGKSAQFDGLRGLACLLVLIPHMRYFGFYLHESIAFGRFAQFGLFLFFFLSAYLISKSVYSEPSTTTLNGWIAYVIRRVFRIAPLYFAVLLIDYFGFQFYFGESGPRDVPSLFNHFTFQEGRSALWTMPVEMAFYFLLIPLMILMGTILRLPKGWKEAGLLWAGSISILWLIYIFLFDRSSLIATWGVHSYAPYFVFGAIWSAILIGMRNFLSQFPQWFWNVSGILALIFFLIQNPLWWQVISPFNKWTYDPQNIDALTFNVYLSWRTYGMVFVVLGMFMALERPASWLTSLMAARPMVFIGKYSFGIYLLHMPIIYFVRDHITTQKQLGFLLVLLFVIPLAMILYKLVERPGITLGARLIRRLQRPASPTLNPQPSGP